MFTITMGIHSFQEAYTTWPFNNSYHHMVHAIHATHATVVHASHAIAIHAAMVHAIHVCHIQHGHAAMVHLAVVDCHFNGSPQFS